MARQADDSKLTNEQLQRLDHCISEARKAWDERFDICRPKFLERYLLGYSSIHAHFLGAGESNAEQFCAVFTGPDFPISPMFWDELDFVILNPVPTQSAEIDGVRNVGVADSDQQEAMFIEIVKVLKDGQRVRSGVHCVVRLRSLDDCLGAPGNSLYYVAPKGFFVFRARETNGVLDLKIRPSVPCQNECPYQMIEAGSQMGNDFASPDRKIQWRQRWAKHAIDVLSSLVVCVRSEIVTVLHKEAGNKLIEPIEIMVGPLDLRPTPVKWM